MSERKKGEGTGKKTEGRGETGVERGSGEANVGIDIVPREAL